MGALLIAAILAVTGIPRTTNADLSALAELRVAEVAAAGTLSHRYLDELDNGAWDGWGEVLALSEGDNDPTSEILVGLVDAWMGSPTHRAVLVDPDFESIGCAAVWSGIRLYAVCVLGDATDSPPSRTSPQPAAATPTPVMVADTAVAH